MIRMLYYGVEVAKIVLMFAAAYFLVRWAHGPTITRKW